jgi:hypothetical protein
MSQLLVAKLRLAVSIHSRYYRGMDFPRPPNLSGFRSLWGHGQESTGPQLLSVGHGRCLKVTAKNR